MHKALGLALLLLAGGAQAAPRLEDALSYPFQTELVSAPSAGVLAWVTVEKGVRNVWMAKGGKPRQVTTNTADDGQELSNLALSADGRWLVWVRGGDHDGNWPAAGDLAPNPAGDPEEPKATVWAADLSVGGGAVRIAEGDFPAVSIKGELAFLRKGQVWTAPLEGKGEAKRLFFDRGADDDLRWSPDGSALAFVSGRGDHAFIGLYRGPGRPLAYLTPSTSRDFSPRWSSQGDRLAFVRLPGAGGPPESLLSEHPEPWSIWTVAADGSDARRVWRSGDGAADSLPPGAGNANLTWADAGTLVFLSEADGWQHLYRVAVTGGPAKLLTPGAFMVEHVSPSAQAGKLVFDANTGPAPEDSDRRHVFLLDVASAQARDLTLGQGVEWSPVFADAGHVAFITADTRNPPRIALAAADGGGLAELSARSAFASAGFVTPRLVTFTAPDGVRIQGQLFAPPEAGRRPAVVFVHGGPPRQMLLGWHYMDYYTHAYAMNQYLAAHGYVVLSVNYRLGIGYGRDFAHPRDGGPRGSSEYQDVAAGGRYLQSLPQVDPRRIGIWGGSYGGLLTALALARNSDIFKVGVDLHGVHDWSSELAQDAPPQRPGYEKDDRDALAKVAFNASPVADLSRWTSPVLLIQGDDDRNVEFHQTVDLARRLEAARIPFEELVLPNEIHGFLRFASWLKADAATVAFLDRYLKP